MTEAYVAPCPDSVEDIRVIEDTDCSTGRKACAAAVHYQITSTGSERICSMPPRVLTGAITTT